MQLGRSRRTAQHRRRPATGDERWGGRPLAALAVRAAVVVVPLLVSVLVAALVSAALPPSNGLSSRIAQVAFVLACSTVALVAADRCTRRLMPLAALLQMSMLFPGRAPSRFAVARQAGSTRRLVELAQQDAAGDGPALAARRTLTLVTALSAHDRRTRGHAERVRVFTDLIAEELRLPQQDRDRLRWAALLHDIGKMSVPKRILTKPGKPTASEWEALRRHPAEGARLTAALLPWLGEWGPVIAQHHERFDGTGYPAGLAGSAICHGARIVAVADAFEVMTAPRSYKRPMPRAAALVELTRCAGSQFDPAVVRAFLSISTPRLRWAMGPLSWLAQLPVLAAMPSTAGLVGQAATGVGVLALGGAVGLGPLGALDAQASGSLHGSSDAGPAGGPTPDPGDAVVASVDRRGAAGNADRLGAAAHGPDGEGKPAGGARGGPKDDVRGSAGHPSRQTHGVQPTPTDTPTPTVAATTAVPTTRVPTTVLPTTALPTAVLPTTGVSPTALVPTTGPSPKPAPISVAPTRALPGH